MNNSAERHRRLRPQNRQNIAGWAFTLPALAILGIFLLIPVLMALWVSFSDWTGRGSPLASSVNFVGFDNYAAITTGGGLAERTFGTAIRNNAWYVLLVVPLQTLLSLALATLVNNAVQRGRSFFRVAFYFPSVTSSVAITVLWLFLFSASGAINKILSYLGITGPNWFNDPSGIFHNVFAWFGVSSPPEPLANHGFLGVSWWEWLAGPSIAMSAFILMAIFTTSGTFMLLFLAGLQNINESTHEAAMIDGANAWQRFWKITVPQLKPTFFTVITLGLIGCWQVFDQIYTGTQGGPGNTTLTPAYLSYQSAFISQEWGQGSAIAFILFAIIVVLTLLQRFLLREKAQIHGPRKRSWLRSSHQGPKLNVANKQVSS